MRKTGTGRFAAPAIAGAGQRPDLKLHQAFLRKSGALASGFTKLSYASTGDVTRHAAEWA